MDKIRLRARAFDGVTVYDDTPTFRQVDGWIEASLTRIRDNAQQGVYFANAYVTPDTYRLTAATGREHAVLTMPTPNGFTPISHPQDTQAQRNYVQEYTYDPVGNIRLMMHRVGPPDFLTVDWKRAYDYSPDGISAQISNRLRATSLAGDDINDPSSFSSIPYTHDAHGNMIAMPHIESLAWDEDDRLQSTDRGSGGTTYYVYDGAGQRIRKVHLNEAETTRKQRLYFGAWELYREEHNINTTPVLDLERATLHIHDETGRICLIETKTAQDDGPIADPVSIARYQYTNHLGTAALELDDAGEVISYEEFHPYGTTSYAAANSAIEVSAKRYRFTGKERDEETGLSYHGARYYAPWLARWIAVDPVGLADGPNPYIYGRSNPVGFSDPSGTKAEEENPTPRPAPSGVLATGEVREGETRREFAGRVITERFAGIDPMERVVIEAEMPEHAGIPEGKFSVGVRGGIEIPPEVVAEFARRFNAVPLTQGERFTPSWLVSGGATTEINPTLAKAAEYFAAALAVVEVALLAESTGLRQATQEFAERVTQKAAQGIRGVRSRIDSWLGARGIGTKSAPGRPPTPPRAGPGGVADDAVNPRTAPSGVSAGSTSPASTPGGRKLTKHAQESLKRHKFKEPYSEVDNIIDNASRTTSQADGGTVYLQKAAGRGRKYNLAIVNEREEVVTAMRNLSPLELKNLGRNYGFNPNP